MKNFELIARNLTHHNDLIESLKRNVNNVNDKLTYVPTTVLDFDYSVAFPDGIHDNFGLAHNCTDNILSALGFETVSELHLIIQRNPNTLGFRFKNNALGQNPSFYDKHALLSNVDIKKATIERYIGDIYLVFVTFDVHDVAPHNYMLTLGIALDSTEIHNAFINVVDTDNLQEKITDLDSIRSGAAKGATALQEEKVFIGTREEYEAVYAEGKILDGSLIILMDEVELETLTSALIGTALVGRMVLGQN